MSDRTQTKSYGWKLIHDAHLGRLRVNVCLKSDPFCHRFGHVVSITTESFTLKGETFKNDVHWGDVNEAWLEDQAPKVCPYCSGDSEVPALALSQPEHQGDEDRLGLRLESWRISPACQGRGHAVAWEDAISRLKQVYDAQLERFEGTPITLSVAIHLQEGDHHD